MSQAKQRDFFGFSRSGFRLLILLGFSAIPISQTGLADDPPTETIPSEEQNARPSEEQRTRPSDRGPRIPGETIEEGYLFLDGEFVPPPYQVEFPSGEVRINGREISRHLSSREAPRANSSAPMRGRWGGRPFFGGSRFAVRTIIGSLTKDNVVMLFEGESPVNLNYREAEQFFEFLLDEDARKSASQSDLSWLPGHANRERITQWLRSFEVPDSLRDPLEELQAKRRALEEEQESQIAAVRRLDQWDYPLTVLGFVLVVGAFGHLISRKPAGEPSDETINIAPEAIRQTNRSLIFVVAMSAMDLVWTILISQAGVMKELNPFGSQMINDPFQLTVFKVAMTAIAVGLIFGLRRYRRAQEASWWGCLLFTILTVRWLTLNTLFV
jgi:hypothetical protein